MELQEGATFDRYRIESAIGRGGMGQVYRAFDHRLRRPVALKILHESLSPDAMARMVREARLAASLTHPNIVAVYDVGEHEGMPYMAMELVEGKQLRQLARAPVNLQDKLRWLIDVARALDAAHRAGLVHRDIKPQNIMITGTGAKVLDFGIAKQLDAAGKNLTALLPSMRTQPGFSVGTPQYMAPEVLRGESLSDTRTDQFSWGIVSYQVLTGEAARRDDLELGSRWVPPKIEVLGISERIAAVVERTLSDDPNARFSTMDDVANALESSSAPLPRTVEQGARHSGAMAMRAVAMPVMAAPKAASVVPVVPELNVPSLAEPAEAEVPRFQPTRLFPVHTPEAAKADAGASAKAKADARANELTPRRRSQRPPKMPSAAPTTPIREPTRAVIQPLANAVLAELSVAIPTGFRKGVVIVTLDVEKSKARFFCQLVATDETGELWTPDASMDLVRAAGAMIADDARDGNGRWQRLVLRVQRGSREAVVAEVL